MEESINIMGLDGGRNGEFASVMSAKGNYQMRQRKTSLDIGTEMLIMIDVSLPDKVIDKIYAVRDGHICSIDKHSEDKTIKEVIDVLVKKKDCDVDY